jgi:hypothetical protein
MVAHRRKVAQCGASIRQIAETSYDNPATAEGYYEFDRRRIEQLIMLSGLALFVVLAAVIPD